MRGWKKNKRPPENIEEWDRSAGNGAGIFLDVIDKRNLTDERLERLKSLMRERDEPSAVNTDELNAKLRQICPRRSPTPSDAPSTPVTAGGVVTEEEHIEFMGRKADVKYKELKNMGGRPSCEINPNPGPCPPWKSDIDKGYYVSDHWGREVGHIKDELIQWLDFRWHQFRMRENLKIFEKKLKWAKRELELAQEKMRKAERNGSIGVPETVLLERAAEVVEYKKKILEARKEAEIAQKRLEALRIEESLSSAERDMLIEQAEEDLESAQKRLEAEKSDELDWGSQHNRDLLEGWERYYAYIRERLQAKQDEDMTWFIQMGWRRGTEAEEARDDLLFPQERVRPLKALLAWIEREFPEITAQYAPFNNDHLDEADPSYSKPSPNEPAPKASQSDVGKSIRRKGGSARKRSPLSQVQPSKVSKPCQRRKRPLNEKLSTTRHAVWPPEGHANDIGQVEERGPPKAAVRKSERISQRTRDPAPRSPGIRSRSQTCSVEHNGQTKINTTHHGPHKHRVLWETARNLEDKALESYV
ncbi:hypothetical protein K469DRAFT_681873 [Zopfia rhizophila CBS 207.26]|uniref:Uncharacterized protein n=1 Tax=Zopfia rhizophila CBS 207.26 TaxID=1314779 RepID=A0A6A6ETW4_9PEZI|nr:hypothetical protein K469DRAFT_681873 [Zopfia rhizophila CBS 207.26]